MRLIVSVVLGGLVPLVAGGCGASAHTTDAGADESDAGSDSGQDAGLADATCPREWADAGVDAGPDVPAQTCAELYEGNPGCSETFSECAEYEDKSPTAGCTTEMLDWIACLDGTTPDCNWFICQEYGRAWSRCLEDYCTDHPSAAECS